MLRLSFLLMFKVMFVMLVSAQQIAVKDWRKHDKGKLTEVRALHHDSLNSSFLIYLKTGVASHKHLNHTEVVTVLWGKARMKLGKEEIVIKTGDIIVIPKGKFHSVVNLKKRHLVVLSVQSPYFDGSDREWEPNASKDEQE